MEWFSRAASLLTAALMWQTGSQVGGHLAEPSDLTASKAQLLLGFERWNRRERRDRSMAEYGRFSSSPRC